MPSDTIDRSWRRAPCPTCGAPPGAQCVTASGKRANTHIARLDAARPKLTPEQIAQREHEHRQHEAQYSKRTLVTVAFTYTCTCRTTPSEPIPLIEANVWPARAVICDEHEEYSVVSGVDVRLVADEATIERILRSADVDGDTARYVAADQNDDARAARIALGRSGEPT